MATNHIRYQQQYGNKHNSWCWAKTRRPVMERQPHDCFNTVFFSIFFSVLYFIPEFHKQILYFKKCLTLQIRKMGIQTCMRTEQKQLFHRSISSHSKTLKCMPSSILSKGSQEPCIWYTVPVFSSFKQVFSFSWFIYIYIFCSKSKLCIFLSTNFIFSQSSGSLKLNSSFNVLTLYRHIKLCWS